ncbi:MAG TPA: hypothetical protein VGM67_12590 [Gemmatimonadaceae bacterium]|jgi:hypothetical protein
MLLARRVWNPALGVILGCIACQADDASVRGHGLKVASLPAATQARMYEAAARADFDVTDPTLSLLADPRLLPRGVGLATEGQLSATVLSTLKSDGIFKGTCEPPVKHKPGAPTCTAERPGYVLRFSPVFSLGGDSTEVYVYTQQYDNAQSGHSQPRRYEKAYQIVRRGGEWRAAREGTIANEIRGEPR